MNDIYVSTGLANQIAVLLHDRVDWTSWVAEARDNVEPIVLTRTNPSALVTWRDHKSHGPSGRDRSVQHRPSEGLV